MAVNGDSEERRVPQRLRGRVTAYVNIGLCLIGAVFIVIGVLRSTLLLYVGCAFIGAAIGGFIRSRLPIHQMHMVPPHLHMVYRHELQRNIQAALQDGVQTFLVVNGQRPMGVDQKTIDKHSMLTTYKPALTATVHKSESVDRISVISSFTDTDEPSCIICLLAFRRGQQIRQLKCQHLFHVECIDKWLKINRLCPTCRIDLTGHITEKTASDLHDSSNIVETANLVTHVTANNESVSVPVVPSVSIVINALEDITRSREDSTFLSDEATSESVTPTDNVSIETTSSCGQSSLSPALPSSNNIDSKGMYELNDEQPQSSSGLGLPCESSKEEDPEDMNVHRPQLSCGRELKPTVITFSMPQNATPWV